MHNVKCDYSVGCVECGVCTVWGAHSVGLFTELGVQCEVCMAVA